VARHRARPRCDTRRTLPRAAKSPSSPAEAPPQAILHRLHRARHAGRVAVAMSLPRRPCLPSSRRSGPRTRRGVFSSWATMPATHELRHGGGAARATKESTWSRRLPPMTWAPASTTNRTSGAASQESSLSEVLRTMARARAPLAELKRIAEKVNARTRTMAWPSDPARCPPGKPTFVLAEDEMEVGGPSWRAPDQRDSRCDLSTTLSTCWWRDRRRPPYRRR